MKEQNGHVPDRPQPRAGTRSARHRGYRLPPLPVPWRRLLGQERRAPWFRRLEAFLDDEARTRTLLPPARDVFRALTLTAPDDVRVVILGQDPYFSPGQAHGLCFSVPAGVEPPPSLRNIFRELHDDLGIETPTNGCLEPWARQGVLLLNTVLTVRSGEPHSHAGRGWERFTDGIIHAVNGLRGRVVFVLWGRPAARKRGLIEEGRHTVITGAHPSPLSAWRGFFGTRPFSAVNRALSAGGRGAIDWRIPQPSGCDPSQQT